MSLTWIKSEPRDNIKTKFHLTFLYTELAMLERTAPAQPSVAIMHTLPP